MSGVLLSRSPVWWAAAVATCGNLAIGFGAFWLSFTALSDLARLAGVPEDQAWVWAVIVDGLIVISTVAVVALDGSGWRAVAYPWTLLALSAGVSVVANVLHAMVQAAPEVPAPLAGAIAAVPPLVLIATTHLTVILIRHAGRAPAPPPTDGPPPAKEVSLFEESPRVNEPAPTESATPVAAPVTSVPEARPEEPAAVPVKTARTARPPRASAQPAARARAQELFAQGWSSRQIAAETGFHRSTISRWVTPAAAANHDAGGSVGTE